MSTKYHNLINHLHKVRPATPRANKGQVEAHRADCLLCDAKSSVSTALNGDGTILFHTFCGCGESSLNAIGLTRADLMPDQPFGHFRKPIQPTEWQSVASLADAVAWAAAVASNDPTNENLSMVVMYSDALRRASVEAMRAGGAR